MVAKLGPSECNVLLEAHIATKNDALSKIGTKHAAVNAEPEKYLAEFGETDVLSGIDIDNLERYLVRVWSPNTAAPTFDELRITTYRKPGRSLESLPPTSTSIQGHIRRTFFVIRDSMLL